MRAVVQRVKSSRVEVSGKVVSEIGFGLNVLVGICDGDTIDDIKYLKDKILNLRIFDEDDKMNKSLIDVGGELLIVSQFTLYGDCRKGRRPSFMRALGGEQSEKLYLEFVKQCAEVIGEVKTGEFGADMQVYIQNDGPVTLLLESKKDF
ncbi:D-aminoacyl-tRNA deacylase [Clostridium estertheticum]|uniref:D-aminoacyl-tRNA deacylase n=1 Tax=Clostridium estertheticum subsp. estertheticum TaxID=1552 RepID=A0A1J0GI97_9CLOT|nr:D-aminoacyl-tRNA deacylase [Clostridium estertheticum]APC40688.1 D-tyrosyl-tRNA(Tyr) deacylase [Clostridium estertheticum subsp. estertheticum]MBU3170913.1 D-tyrosyl-tRNA(Tyr) deacylase [Clostridium estertheticum]MBZ9617481.1 D-tyrosyl-tRNA(Tyr) deacylase [Clostridium estertheticum subsp. laramiense]MCB2342007.1 D-tyrosyl-tRNA(Tyr) deacylase [Clostridium estertheticum]WAG73160.1 D-tyrosyl-tRNA(Tyr) deacylase [Clostridium estertheticum]